MFGSSEQQQQQQQQSKSRSSSKLSPPPPPSTGRVLVTGGANGVPVGRPGWPNRLMILGFKQDRSAPADLGPCTVLYEWRVDDDSVAHFSAINERSEDVYLAEVAVNKLHKYKFKSN